MKIFAFSDWRVQDISQVYSILDTLYRDIDFIIYAGDDIDRFNDRGVNHFSELAKKTKQKKVLAVIGNDDIHEVKEVLNVERVHDLHNEPFIYENYAFIGLEGSTKGPGLVKYTERQVNKHLQNHYKKVKGKKIVVVSHTPPHGVLDMGIRFGVSHIGSTSLRDFILKNNPKMVICGHCHSHGGLSENLKNCKVFNVSSHDSPNSTGNMAIIELGDEIEVEWEYTSNLPADSLQRLYGVGPQKEDLLKKMGIKNIQDLVRLELDNMNSDSYFSKSFLNKLKIIAQSISDNIIYQIRPFDLNAENIVYFDIETDLNCTKVWLIGVLYKGEFKQFYANNWKGEKKILSDFINYLKKLGNIRLYTFSSTSFDREVVLKALNRLNLDAGYFSALPHHDICVEIRRSFIVPIQTYALKKLGKLLKYPFKHGDMDGFFVALEYHRHIEDKSKLPKKIFEYNKDDVRAIPFIIEQLKNNDNLQIKKNFVCVDKTSMKSATLELQKEIEELKKLRLKGHTIKELSKMFGKSNYYIYSRLNRKYGGARAYKNLND